MSPVRVLRGFIFGALGGVLGWLLVEFLPPPFPSPPFRPFLTERPGALVPPVTPEQMGLLGIVVGLSICGFLGLSEGMAEGTVSRLRRALLWFLGLGIIGGFVGLFYGQILYAQLGGGSPNTPFVQELIARSLGWMLIGLFIGVIFGVPNLSVRRSVNGAIGGALGGFLGGFFFQTLTGTQVFQAMHGRFIGFAMVGAMIGFFISLIAEAMKQVWVQVLVGRNEGREHVIDTPLVYIGRDELADVPVFLDPAIPKRIASLRLANGRYGLYPESALPPILVNGEALEPGRLMKDGDAIQFGRVTLAYFEKATATGLRRPVDSVALASPARAGTAPSLAIPGGNMCAFCGQPKDVAGNCACTVGAGAVPAGVTGYAAAGGDPGYAATVMDPGTIPAYSPAEAADGPRLVGVGGPHAGQVFPLTAEVMSMGRDPSQMIPLTSDTTASRRHALVQYVAGAWSVRDAGSSNGTWVNGVRIQDQPLFPGDVIRVGQSELRFEF